MFRKKPDNQELQPPEEQLFDFWLEYFSDACEEEKSQSTIRFPVSDSIQFNTFILLYCNSAKQEPLIGFGFQEGGGFKVMDCLFIFLFSVMTLRIPPLTRTRILR